MAYKPQTVFQPTRTPMPMSSAAPPALPNSQKPAQPLPPAPVNVAQTQQVQQPQTPQVSTPPNPSPVAPTPNPATAGGPPPGISARAWKSHQEINSNISPEQWQAWDQFYDPGCPSGSPYRSQKTVNGQPGGACAETPDNCPEGTQAFGPNDCRASSSIPGQGGPGFGIPGGPEAGGGGAGGTGGTGIPGGGAFGNQDDFLWKALMDRLSQGSRWNDTTLATVLGDVKAGAESAADSQTDDYNQNLAQRGLARSEVGNQGYRDIRANAGNQVLAAKSQILKAKVDADYQDQSDTLAKMQDWINARRNAILSSNQTEAQKRIAMAQLQLGYAQLEQQMNMLREEYAQKLSLVGLQL